ncbi:hypothetical protein ZIOFF_066101 [Zingiber officinale]|uniref:MULE transposase domain-containing protein n=1 Tax=Zingiber officinale TaxID=94328 RepID=A0A8J5KDL0_ZINOF|nr:hypothetical protein ZIOFF_066101 [Zingiber officinale]
MSNYESNDDVCIEHDSDNEFETDLLDALRKGFLEGCKPSIGFDGCHLKGPYGDVLLSAIGLDGNNQLFPIAFTIVESENKYAWYFFFELLSNFLAGFGKNRE